jgi:hypothetical protein
MNNPFTSWFNRKKEKKIEPKATVTEKPASMVPGRVSQPEDDVNDTLLYSLKDMTRMVTPSFRTEVIPLIRDLYKVNPDVGIALQDMFKLANTGHKISFPNNTDDEADKMRDHLLKVSRKWSAYTSGIDGLITRMMVQSFIGGAISIEAVPNEKIDGLSTILFLKPENIKFHRSNNGTYEPYQKLTYTQKASAKQDYIKLNPETFIYVSTYNDTDEPYGIPPFMAALDSLKSQSDMQVNMKHIMELCGMVGFFEALMEKPTQRGSESVEAYRHRLNRTLRDLKRNIKDGLKDGVVVGYKDDHEFKMNSTTKDMGNVEKPWQINQQSVANGLGVNGTIIGVNSSSSEGSAGISLSKMISQLHYIQEMVSYALIRIYELELLLAGFNSKGITITWKPSTISDDVKIQQARQYQVQYLNTLYAAGIISQQQYAWELGYDSPAETEPRVPLDGIDSDIQEAAKKRQRQDDKNQSARRTRDKNKVNPKRGDQDTKTR